MDEKRPAISAAQQEGALQRAKDAVAAGDPKGMTVALYESGVLDGLVFRLRGKWPDLAFDDVDYAVGQAVDVLYQAVTRGDRVANLVAFLWKVSDRRLWDRDREAKRERATDPAEIAMRRDETAADEGAGERDASEETSRDERRAKALAVARSLLPRLGQENVQVVMAYVLDAVEAGREDICNQEIADALGLSGDTIRTSLSRGFRRLERIAREENLADLTLETDAIRPSDGEDEDLSGAEDVV